MHVFILDFVFYIEKPHFIEPWNLDIIIVINGDCGSLIQVQISIKI